METELEKGIEFARRGLLWDFLMKTPSNSGRTWFCVEELQHTKRFTNNATGTLQK